MSKRKELLNHLDFDTAAQSKPYDDATGKPIRWKLVASFAPVPDAPIVELGISENGTWVVPATDATVWDVDETGRYMTLFPLLLMSYFQARNVLELEFGRHGIDPQWVSEFPFAKIAASALKTSFGGWPDGALEWAPSLPPSDDLRDGLTFLNKQGRTQHQRHRAAKLLRQLQR